MYISRKNPLQIRKWAFPPLPGYSSPHAPLPLSDFPRFRYPPGAGAGEFFPQKTLDSTDYPAPPWISGSTTCWSCCPACAFYKLGFVLYSSHDFCLNSPFLLFNLSYHHVKGKNSFFPEKARESISGLCVTFSLVRRGAAILSFLSMVPVTDTFDLIQRPIARYFQLSSDLFFFMGFNDLEAS